MLACLKRSAMSESREPPATVTSPACKQQLPRGPSTCTTARRARSMQNRSSSGGLLTFTVVLVAAIALVGAVPAAAVKIGGTDYALFAQCQLGMEDGPTTITGNIAVNEICGALNGFLRVGAHNVVNGTATANRMFFGTASTVTTCEFNVLTGGNASAACGNIPPDPIPPGASLPITAWPPITPLPSVTPGATDFVCQASQTCSPPAGQYRDIRAGDNATINLDGGTYQARNLFLE